MAASDPIAVIGGGLGGLASAVVLRARGHPVMLFEHNDWLGGKAAELRLDGFRFDMGPTILTVPGVLMRIFREAGRRVEDTLDLVRLDPQWRCFFEDGSVLDLVEDTAAMAGGSRSTRPAPVRGTAIAGCRSYRASCTTSRSASSSGGRSRGSPTRST